MCVGVCGGPVPQGWPAVTETAPSVPKGNNYPLRSLEKAGPQVQLREPLLLSPVVVALAGPSPRKMGGTRQMGGSPSPSDHGEEMRREGGWQEGARESRAVLSWSAGRQRHWPGIRPWTDALSEPWARLLSHLLSRSQFCLLVKLWSDGSDGNSMIVSEIEYSSRFPATSANRVVGEVSKYRCRGSLVGDRLGSPFFCDGAEGL